MPTTKVELVDAIFNEMRDPKVTKTMVKEFLEAQRMVLIQSVKEDGVATIPRVIKIMSRQMGRRPARRARDPRTESIVKVKAKPPGMKLRARFLVDFKIGVGAELRKNDCRALETRKVEKLRLELREAVSKKLTLNEKRAVGLVRGKVELPVPKRTRGRPRKDSEV